MLARISKICLVVLLALLPVVLSAQAALININTAGPEELQTLKGIGPVKAQAIISYRTQNGLFQTIEDIQNVSGIGSVTFNNIKSFITVGDVGTSEDEKEYKGTATTTPEITGSSSEPASSAHYNATSLSNKKPEMTSSVSAGRDRLGSVGGPLEFRAETNFQYTKSSIFKWNFGDGTEGVGPVLNHTYEYPGEYVVVLNTTLPEGQAISRVNVKIIEPELSIILATPERIEIKNNSRYEASLFGKAIISAGKAFVFPQDTIVKAGRSISFSSRVTDLHPVSSSDAIILTVGNAEPSKLAAKIEEEKTEKIAYLQNQIELLKQRVANISLSPNLAVQPPSEELPSENLPELGETRTAAVVKSGWLQILKRFFLRTQQ